MACITSADNDCFVTVTVLVQVRELCWAKETPLGSSGGEYELFIMKTVASFRSEEILSVHETKHLPVRHTAAFGATLLHLEVWPHQEFTISELLQVPKGREELQQFLQKRQLYREQHVEFYCYIFDKRKACITAPNPRCLPYGQYFYSKEDGTILELDVAVESESSKVHKQLEKGLKCLDLFAGVNSSSMCVQQNSAL